MSRDVLTVGSTMRIPLLYRGEYSQWVERFMNYLKEQTDGEAMINSIKNGDQPLPRVTQVSIAGTTSTEQPPLKAKSMWKVVVLYEYETFKATKGELLLDTYIRYLQVINDLKKYGYSKDNYVNDAMGSKKKNVVVTFDPLALIAKKTKVSKSKEKVVVSLDSEGSEADDFSELKKITALLAKAFKASSSSADEKISEVSYYLSESESESEYETSEYYDNSANYGLFVNNDDDQEIFHDGIEFASENFIENHIISQRDYDKSDVDHNDSKEKDHVVDKLIRKFNKKIVKCQKRIEKANQQSNDFENQNKNLQDKYDVLKIKQLLLR
nr:hypothetical protein [Tanacetum cinerariifolium]